MLPVNWPFNPKRSPLFYGWIIWLFSTAGFLCSIPGQTMGMAVFTDTFIEVLGLSRTEVSLAYLLGTIASSLFLTRAGAWYDRLGGRIMIAGSAAALGVMILFISIVDRLSGILGGSTAVTFTLLLSAFFGVRFFGQGVLTSCSRNVLLLWFVRRRGLVSGIRSVFVSFGFAIAPLAIASLISQFDWRGALWVMALGVGIVFALLSLIFIRDNPASCGLEPDGDATPAERSVRREAPSQTVSEARRSPVFWIYSLSLGMHALFGTGLTFHVIAVFAEQGLTPTVALGYFFPAAVFSTLSNLLASTVVDRGPLKPYLLLMLSSLICGALGLINLQHSWGYWVLAAGFGIGGGLWGVVSNLAFIRFFGPLHLGAVSGFNASISVFASAIGPAAFSLATDFLGSYNAAAQICCAGLVLLLAAAVLIPQSGEVYPRSQAGPTGMQK